MSGAWVHAMLEKLQLDITNRLHLLCKEQEYKLASVTHRLKAALFAIIQN